jgi:hypothetical protein
MDGMGESCVTYRSRIKLTIVVGLLATLLIGNIEEPSGWRAKRHNIQFSEIGLLKDMVKTLRRG